MDTHTLTRHFRRLGARLRLADRLPQRGGGDGPVALDVRTDNRGEFFEVAVRPGERVELDAVDVRPEHRHLLLLVREGREKSKFVCGHDERHWFVAAVPESARGVGTVRTALEALKPGEVRAAEDRQRVRSTDRVRRKNAAFVRQGEWFFLPEPGLVVDASLVRRGEPLSRGLGSKPHVAEYGYRSGGETVYVCPEYSAGLLQVDYSRLLARKPAAGRWAWRLMRRDAAVYVRGRVRHADHATVFLPGWHRVLMNTEGQARAMRRVAFLD